MNSKPPPPKTAELVELIQALHEERLGPEDAARLDCWIRGDEAARWIYVQYMNLYAGLAWDRTLPKAEDAHFPPIVIDAGSPLATPFFALRPSLRGWLFSYAAATVVTGVMLLVLWTWKVSHQQELAVLPPAAPPPAGERERPGEYVGRISGTADCRWADPETAGRAASRPSLWGRSTPSASGLMEISYDSGAKVILQGPCTYEIDSPARRLPLAGETDGQSGKAFSYQRSAIRNLQISKSPNL